MSFPGPKGSILLFDSPDRVLLAWSRQKECDGSELDRFQQCCVQLLEFHNEGTHSVEPCWGTKAPAPEPEGIMAGLLLKTLQASPDLFDAYLKLDPHYVHRLTRSQTLPKQLLIQYLQTQGHGTQCLPHNKDQRMIDLNELEKWKKERNFFETLLEQHKDQQNRTRHLIVKLLKNQAID